MTFPESLSTAARGQEKIHRPGGNSIQDPCITRNAQCVIADHYVVDVLSQYAQNVLEAEKVSTARALVALFDEYKRECEKDSVIELVYFDCGEPGCLVYGHYGLREKKNLKKLSATDFLDRYLRKKVNIGNN